MGIAEKMWDGIATVIKMNDKVERLAATVVAQQQKLENLTERVIRLETALELALAQAQRAPKATRQLPHKD